MPDKNVAKKVPTQEIIRKVMMWVNILIAMIVIGLGFYKYIAGNFDSFSQIFVPFYLIMFGLLLICSELEWLFMVKYFKFADNFFGRGLYNLFLATMVMNSITTNFQQTTQKTGLWVLVVVISSLLAAVGFLEIIFYVLHCGGKSQKFENYDLNQQLLQKQQQQQQQKQQQQQQSTKQNPPDIIVQQSPAEYMKWLQDQMTITQQKMGEIPL